MQEFITQFTEQIQSGQFSVFLIIASFSGGLLASLSPCTLGILPIIAGLVGGYDHDKNTFKTFIQMVFFVLGLSLILTAIGIICAVSGKVFMAIGGSYWILFMASLIMIFGLNLLGVVEIPIPNFVKRMPKSKGSSLFVYPFILGIMFALAATPCSTPILASIMSFATLSKDIGYAALLLLAFSLGQGIIIILVGVFTSVIKNMRAFNNYSSVLMKFCGILLIVSAIILYLKVFSRFLG